MSSSFTLPPLPFQPLLDSYRAITGNELTPQTMQLLNTSQLTLVAYDILRREVMEGGFIQLIYNGYGAFIFQNPFGTLMRQWGIDRMATLINKARQHYRHYAPQIMAAQTDDDFMALYEQMPQFDSCDDLFIDIEEDITRQILAYTEQHPEEFLPADEQHKNQEPQGIV